MDAAGILGSVLGFAGSAVTLIYETYSDCPCLVEKSADPVWHLAHPDATQCQGGKIPAIKTEVAATGAVVPKLSLRQYQGLGGLVTEEDYLLILPATASTTNLKRVRYGGVEYQVLHPSVPEASGHDLLCHIDLQRGSLQ